MSHKLDWKVYKSEYVLNSKWLKVRADDCISPNGHSIAPYYVIEYPDWINTFGITKNNMVVLVRQYRHGIGRTLIELPSGTIEPGEDPVETAKRELLEETGYSGSFFKQVGRVCPNTANHKNITYSILATGLEKIAEPVVDETELIETVLVSIDEVVKMAKRGDFLQALHTSSVFFALSELGIL